jgi:hypothetical protein
VHRALARQRRVLLVQREHAAAQALVLQRAAKDAGVGNRPAVVGEARGAERAQLGHLGQLAALQPARDRRHEADRDACLPGGGVQQRPQDRRAVDDRVRVGHGDDGAVPARRGRPRAGLEVLLVLLTGRAQVHVRVDEGREQVAPVALDGLRVSGRRERSGRADLGDLATPHDHVVQAVEAPARVQRADVAQQQVGGPRRRADEAHALGGAAVDGLVRAHASCGSVGRGALRSSRVPARTS